jgi:hypothetical protein
MGEHAQAMLAAFRATPGRPDRDDGLRTWTCSTDGSVTTTRGLEAAARHSAPKVRKSLSAVFPAEL